LKKINFEIKVRASSFLAKLKFFNGRKSLKKKLGTASILLHTIYTSINMKVHNMPEKMFYYIGEKIYFQRSNFHFRLHILRINAIQSRLFR